jgi:NAD(P)H-quinone oxidoreductase subunit 4L
MSLHAYLLLGLVLFVLGLLGVLSRRNLIGVLIGIELMMNAASLNFMAFNRYCVTDPTTGQIFVLIIIGLAAAEVAIFLAIIMRLSRIYQTIDAEQLTELKG